MNKSPEIHSISDIPVLVSSLAVANNLLAQSNRLKRRAGIDVWRRPAFNTFSTWIRKLWSQVPVSADFSRPVLLTPVQELALWQDIIKESGWSNVLMQTGSLARHASQANRLLHEWQIPVAELDNFSVDESLALKSWIKEFEKRCRQCDWLPAYRLPEFLRELPTNTLELPAQLVLYDLQSLTPQQSDLIDYLEKQDCDVNHVSPAQLDSEPLSTRFSEGEQELLAAANWARIRLNENPLASVAIALPDVAGQSDDLRRCLDRVFFQNCPFPSKAANPVYNTETGPLASHAMIDTALRILGQSHYRVDLAEFGQITRSIYVAGSSEEWFERSRLDLHLRALGEVTPSIGFISSQIVDKETGEFSFQCNRLHKCLRDWLKAIDALPRKQSPSAWASSISNLLKAWGWPNGALPGLKEGEIVDSWNDVLSQLCSLDSVTPGIDFEAAILWLRRAAREAGRPRQNTQDRLHVISIEDAASLNFDHLWIAGLDDDSWPPAARPNPLLPIAIQRRAGIPESSSQLVAEQAAYWLAAAATSSTEVVMSYANFAGDRELRPASFLRNIQEADASSLVSMPSLAARTIFDAGQTEIISDLTAPFPSEQPRGGTSILKNQAACPIRAYIGHRLFAQVPEEPELGLDASERGTLMHNVLENVWAMFRSHSGLVAADEAEREHIVTEAASNALERMVWRKPESVTPKFRELELERLVMRVMAWLYWEESRDSFTVLKPEMEQEITLGKLKIQMRIDRIDQNAIGERIIIDYKTGTASVSSWFGDRPDEPQLPLYALAEMEAGHPVAAICFAQVRPGEFAFKGISNAEKVLPGVKSVEKQSQTKEHGDWQTLLDQWRATMLKLAADFTDGVAPVDPKSVSSCQYCEFGSTCRINELRQRAGREPVEVEPGDC